MKNLRSFILEAKEKQNEKPVEKTTSISFNFDGLDGAEDAMKDIKSKLDDCSASYSSKDSKLTLNLDSDLDKLSSAIDAIKDFSNKNMKSNKYASNEVFAGKAKAFSNSVAKIDAFKASLESSEEE